jgi:hypothetical protein
MSKRRSRRRARGARPERPQLVARVAVQGGSAWHETDHVERLVYTRRQAAEALGMSVTTLDRRVIPAVETVKMPWGARMIPVRELERLVAEHIEPPRVPEHAPAAVRGRPRTVPAEVVTRIRRERAAGRSLRSIAVGLEADGVPTGQAGARWWPSSVASLARRSEPQQP